MSSGKRSRVGRNVVKPLVLAVALALPGAAAYAESMTDVVTTRSDQNIHEQYGRDSVYAFSNYAKPYKPEQTGSHTTGFIGDAFHKTGHFFTNVWDKTTGLFHREGSSSSVSTAQYEPQPYGRAGGYTGTDRVEVVTGAPRSYAANSEIVKSGQDVSPMANDTAATDEALSSRANSTVDTRDMAGNRDTMTRSARDNSPQSGSAPSAGTSSGNASGAVTPNDNPPSAAAPSDKASSAVYPEDKKLTPATRDSAIAPSNGSDIQGQSTMSPGEDQRSMQDQSSGTGGDVVRSGTAATDNGTAATDNGTAATDNSGRTEGRRFDHPDSAHGQMENDTQTR